MLELRFPPAHLADEQHVANVREVIASVLGAQKTLGNRAGNQAIVDQIGLEVRLVRDEAYLGEALDYHLGLLYAHVGDPQRAAFHIERSGTHPGTGGNQIFSDHMHESLELRRRQDLAIARSIPPVLIPSMPRSASASLTQTIAALLDAPIMRVSSGRYPHFCILPRWLNSFLRGGAVLHDHFGADPFNLKTLRDAGVRNVFVRIRDPRPAACSATNLSDRKSGTADPASFEDRVLALYHKSFVPWLQGWITAASDSAAGLRVHWVPHGPSNATGDAARQILSVLAATHPALGAFATNDVAEVKANFVTGDDEAWRTRISTSGQEQLWERTPDEVKRLMSLRA
jgi:hypothetical protein